MDFDNTFSNGYKDNSIEEYMVHIDFIYTIEDVSYGYISIKCVDTSIYVKSELKNESTFKWVFKKDGKVIGESDEKSATAYFQICKEIEVYYTITNKYGISYIHRTLFFNTYPTINALLNRTSTAISKEEMGNNYKLLSIDAGEYDLLYKTIPTLMKSGYIKYATGISLDYLGELWAVYRLAGETDDAYRARIIQAISAADTKITKISLQQLIATAYGIPLDKVELVEREHQPDYSWCYSGGDSRWGNLRWGVDRWGGGSTPTKVGWGDCRWGDCSWGSSGGWTPCEWMGPYNPDECPAEFTYFIYQEPSHPVNIPYIHKLIDEARACGVHFNKPKVTYISTFDKEIDIQLVDIELYDTITPIPDMGWGADKWGADGEILKPNVNPMKHEFEVPGDYVITAIGDGIENDAFIEKDVTVIEGADKTKWGDSRWDESRWPRA